MRRCISWGLSVSAQFSDRRGRFRAGSRGHAFGVSAIELCADRAELTLFELADWDPAPAIRRANHRAYISLRTGRSPKAWGMILVRRR
jgi:hypothetical protein